MTPIALLIVTAIIPCVAGLLRELGWYMLVWSITKRDPKRAAKIIDAARPRTRWRRCG